MPPEPLPWDRKEYAFKNHRKYDGGAPGTDTLSGGGGTPPSAPRWRDAYHSPRYLPRASPRRMPGQCRQGGGYHPVYPEDFGDHDFTSSRSDRFWSEEECFRLSSSGRYGGGGRCSKDGHATFRRSPYWDSTDFSPRLNHEPRATAHRSVAATNSSSTQTPLKDLNDKSGDGGGDNDGLGTGHRFYHQDHSLGSSSWKPSLKWSRPGNLGLTRISGSEMADAGLQVVVNGEKEIASKSLVVPPLPSDEGPPHKKPRLGWGQGLAKYEKQKVEGSADTSETGAKGSLSDTSPKVSSLSGCLSPTTPCSTNRSFSLGFSLIVEHKPDLRSLTDEDEKCHKGCLTGESPCVAPSKCDHLDSDHAGALSSLLAGLSHSDDVCPMASALSTHSILIKLLILKEDISKELEKTESVIDRFENELKALDCGSSDVSQQREATVLESSEPCEQLSNGSNSSEVKNVASTSCTELPKESLPCINLDQKTVVEADKGVKGPEPEDTSSKYCQSVSMVMEASESIFRKSDDCIVSPEVENSKVLESQQSSPSDGGGKSSLIASENANKHDAECASVCFDASLCAYPPMSDIWELIDLSTCKKNYVKVKKKLAIRKSLTKFKEKVLVLKFMALRFLWKEDLQLLSLRKHRHRSNKHFEPGSCVLQGGTQKARSAIKSTCVLPGNLTLVPNIEILDLTSKLLWDSEIKRYRNNLKMPALLLDEKEMVCARFGSHNGLIEDPCSFESEKSMINPWSQEEKEVFMELLATFGKDFTKISSYLQHKTTADCIELYYKYHKSESFKEVKKRLDLRKIRKCPAACTYLVPSGKKWNIDSSIIIDLPKVDANVDSLDLLGAAWTLASHNHVTAHNQQTVANSGYNDKRLSYEPCDYVERQSNIQLAGHVNEFLNADAIEGVHDVPSSEMSPYATSSPEQAEKENQGEVSPSFKTEVYENFNEDSCSDDGCVELDSTDWTDHEKSIFMRSLSTCGKDFARIASCVGTRSREQCKIFYSKARRCLGLDKIHQDSDTRNIPLSDTNGGKSDTDDACTVKMASTICDINFCSKLEDDLSDSGVNIGGDGFVPALRTFLQTDAKEDLVGCISLNKNNAVDKKVLISPVDLELNDHISSRCDKVPSVDAATQFDNTACANQETKVIGSNSSIVPNRLGQDEMNQLNNSSIQHEYSGASALAVNWKVEAKPISFPECVLMNQEKANIDFSSGSSSLRIPDNSDRNEIGILKGNKIDCSQFTFVPNHQHQVQLENACNMPLDTFRPDPSSISFGGNLNMLSQSTLNFEGHGNRQLRNVKDNDLHQQCMVRSPSVEVDRNLHILRGHPLQVLIQEKKREAGIASENSVLLETHANKNGISHSSQLFLSDIHGISHDISSLSHSRSAILCPLSSENLPESQVRPCIQNASSDTDAHRPCDVKLFGAVLSHSSSLQNSRFSAHENNSGPQSPPVPRSSNGSPFIGSTYAFSLSKSSHAGVVEQSVRSHSFWDGNRMQTGLSSLPESSVALTKYHGSLVGGSPCNNGLLTGYQQSYMPQMSSDGKCGEIPKNGVEIISGFQQQVKLAGTGKNVVVGGISDPVAALQLHFAARSSHSAVKLSHGGQS